MAGKRKGGEKSKPRTIIPKDEFSRRRRESDPELQFIEEGIVDDGG